MSEEKTISERLPDDNTIQIGNVAFGRSGFRPVVSLPDDQSQRLARAIDGLEYLAIVLFMISAAMVFVGRLGIDRAFYISLVVIALRGATILISMIIIAKPIEEFESVDKVPEFVGDGGAITFEDINLTVSVSDAKVALTFINNSRKPATVNVQLSSRHGRVGIPNTTHGAELETRFSEEKVVNPMESKATLEFEMEITEDITERDTDIIDIYISGNKINKDTEPYPVTPIDEIELVLPVEITNADEIIEESKEHMIIRR